MELSTATIAILCLIGLVISIVVGSVKKVNIGILSLIFAYVIGCVLMGKFASSVTLLFPVKIMMYLLTVCYFYGFAIANGTFQALGDRIIYAFRKHAALLPWGILLGAIIVAGAGGGGLMGVIVMAPIAFALVKKVNMHPLLAYMAVAMGSPIGGTFFWSVGGVTTKSIAESSGFLPEVAGALVGQQSITLAIAELSFFLILYLVLKGYKIQNIDIAKPEPMEKKQRITLGLIIAVILLVIIPGFINIVAPNPITRYLGNYVFEIQLLSLIGGAICTLMHLGDEREVIKNHIPWGMILVICGVGTLIAVASNYGVIAMVAGWLGDNVSAEAMTLLMTAIGGVMSFISDGMGVCMPTFYPIMNEIASITGAGVAPMFLGFTTAIWVTGASPISSAGGLAISFASEEGGARSKLFIQAIVTTLLALVWLLILAFVGVFNLFG